MKEQLLNGIQIKHLYVVTLLLSVVNLLCSEPHTKSPVDSHRQGYSNKDVPRQGYLSKDGQKSILGHRHVTGRRSLEYFLSEISDDDMSAGSWWDSTL